MKPAVSHQERNVGAITFGDDSPLVEKSHSSLAPGRRLQLIHSFRECVLKGGYAIPEGLLADKWTPHLHREAENLLPLPFRQVVEASSVPPIYEARQFTLRERFYADA